METYEFFMEKYIIFEVFIPLSKGIRPFRVLFPKYKFKTAYMSIPLSKRASAGRFNVFMEIYKLKEGKIRISTIENWENRID